MNLYKNIEENIQKDKSAEAGDESLKDNQDNLHINNTKIIFDLNNLQYIFSINLQKFLIKDMFKSGLHPNYHPSYGNTMQNSAISSMLHCKTEI